MRGHISQGPPLLKRSWTVRLGEGRGYRKGLRKQGTLQQYLPYFPQTRLGVRGGETFQDEGTTCAKACRREAAWGVQGTARGFVRMEDREGSWEGPSQPRVSRAGPRDRSPRAEEFGHSPEDARASRKGLEQERKQRSFTFGAVVCAQRERQTGRPVRGQGRPGAVPPISSPPCRPRAHEGWEVGAKVLPRWSWEEWLAEVREGGCEDSTPSCALQ